MKNKEIFPGGKYNLQTHAAEQQAIQAKQNRKLFGIKAHAIIARKTATFFIGTVMASMALGSLHWWIMEDPESISYKTAFRRAYNIKNAFDREKWNQENIPDALCPTTTMLMLVLGGLFASSYRRYLDNEADRVVRLIQTEQNRTIRDFTLMSRLYYDLPESDDKLSSISYAIICNMSSKNDALYNNLIKGITRYPTAHYSCAVLDGYLKSHPEEFHKITNKYNYHSLPKKIIKKYDKRQR